MIEALVSISIAVLASSALCLGITSSLQNVDASLEQAIAAGLAEQLVDEVLGGEYAEPENVYATTLGPSSYESGGNGRERYTESGDYNGFSAQPCQDPYGAVRGRDDGSGGERHPNFLAANSFLADWREEVEVYYVSDSDLSVRLPPGQTSNFRAIEVRILKDDGSDELREVFTLRRLIGRIPQP